MLVQLERQLENGQVLNKKNSRTKLKALLLGSVFALLVLELSLRFFGFVENFQRYSTSHQAKASYTILNLGNSHTVGTGAPPGKDYSTQLEIMLNEITPKRYAVINRGRVNVNTAYIRENIAEWLKVDRPNIVFLMTGEANRWNKYNYAKYLEEKNHAGSFQLNYFYDQIRFFKSFRLGELLLNKNETKEGNSSTFKEVSLTKAPRTLGYMWLGHLERESVYKTKNLTELQGDEAISALKYIYEKDNSQVAARLIAAIYLQVFHNEDLFLEYIEKSIKLAGRFNYETLQLFRLNESLMRDKSRKFVKSYIENLDHSSMPITIKEIEEWYLFEKPLKLKSLKDEIAFILKLHTLNPTDFKLYESLSRRNTSAAILMEVAERSLVLNPLSPQTNILSLLKISINGTPELQERYKKLVTDVSTKAGIEDIKALGLEDDLEKDWIISDLEAIINIIQNSGAKVVVQTYAPYRKGNPRFSDEVIRQWWKSHPRLDVEFMDVGLMLKDKFNTEKGGQKYYSTRFGDKDEHPGSLGYYEIAKLMIPYVFNNDKK